MSSPLKYRRDIDGLRAIAVMAVVLFHAGLPSLDGGFVGVDIFFVISGFLITSILVKEAEQTGTISVSNFYARRVRRLMPAGLLVVITVLIVGLFLYPADGERQSLIASAIAATLFISNIYFWRKAGYFAESSENLPLLHTWTLSVEEQFYVFWPLLILTVLWAARRFKWNFHLCLLLSFLSVCSVSFIIAQWLIASRPSAAFYLVIARAFELGAGALLALYLNRPLAEKTRLGTAISFFGLIALAVTIFTFDAKTLWPGPLSLLVVAGTAALLLGGLMAPKGVISRGLSIEPMVFIGKISYSWYSWYLWHWPFLVFLNYYSFGETELWQRLLAVLASLLVSIFSYYAVEQPIRYAKVRPFESVKGSLAAGGVMIAVITALSFGLYKHAESELAGSAQLQASVAAKKKVTLVPAGCFHYQAQFANLEPWAKCRVAPPSGTVEKKVIIFGDSHALSLQSAYKYLADNSNVEFVLRTKPGCRPFRGAYMLVVAETPAIRRACEGFYAATMSELAELYEAGYEQLWLISRWPPAGTPEAESALWETALAEMVEKARQVGLSVVIFTAPPQFKYSVPRCVSRLSESRCSLPRAQADIIHNAQMRVLRTIAAKKHVEIFDMFNELCGDKQCPASKDGAVLYSDDNHISTFAAELIGRRFSTQLE